MTQSLEKLSESTEQLYRFNQRLDNESYKRLVEQRDKVFFRMEHRKGEARSLSSRSLSVWDRKPVDFSRKKYDPRPPKRNGRESMRPWTYDRFLRKPEDESIFWEKEPAKRRCNEILLEKTLNGPDEEGNFEDFETSHRPTTPQMDRMFVSKSFRNPVEKYETPRDHDFRGLKPLLGWPKFETGYEKDPGKLKFLTENLNRIHGLADGDCLRTFENDHQMGDLVKKKEPKYEPKLLLPRLEYPNKYTAYTRFQVANEGAEENFWGRLVPSFNEECKKYEELMKQKKS